MIMSNLIDILKICILSFRSLHYVTSSICKINILKSQSYLVRKEKGKGLFHVLISHPRNLSHLYHFTFLGISRDVWDTTKTMKGEPLSMNQL